jgi:hypothetical protein
MPTTFAFLVAQPTNTGRRRSLDWEPSKGKRFIFQFRIDRKRTRLSSKMLLLVQETPEAKPKTALLPMPRA